MAEDPKVRFIKTSDEIYNANLESIDDYAFYKTEDKVFLGKKELSNEVTGVKGSNETLFRVGEVTITKDNIGLGKADNTPDAEKAVLSATKLATIRTILTDLASNTAADFDGTKNVTPGVKGVLGLANGGTGNTTGTAQYLASHNILEGTDLNTLTDSGFYVTAEAGLAVKLVNCPVPNGSIALCTIKRGPVNSAQILVSQASATDVRLFIRTCYQDEWGEWIQVYTPNNPQKDITGNAATATKLTSSAGSETQPVYFKDGKPVVTAHALEPVTTTKEGLMSAADKVKLDGIDTNANKYTLPVASATVLGGVKSGTDISVDASGNVSVVDDSHNHVIGNVDGLQAALDAKVPKTTTVNGKALSGNITLSYSDVQAIPASDKGAKGGVATLGTDGKVPSSQLPSYVDDVIEGYLNGGKFYKEDTHTTEIPGEAGKIYIDLHTSKTYRWSGTVFSVISETLALGTTSSTAFYGDKGQTAYEHATAKGTQLASGLWKVTTNAQGHVTAGAAVSKADITGLGIPGSDTTYGNAVANGAAGLMTGADKAKLDGIAAGANAYSLPTASATVLGGVKTGYTTTGKDYAVTIDASGNLHVNVPWTDNNTWVANSATAAGYVASGSGQANKVWKTDANGAPAWRDDADTKYTLPVATSGALGGVKSGGDITVATTGAVTVTHATSANTATSATDNTKLPLAGGTMTGDITFSGARRAIKVNTGTYSSEAITFYDGGDASGGGITIGFGGRTIVGSGESATALRSALGGSDTSEKLYLSSDEDAHVMVKCQTIDQRLDFAFGTDGILTAPVGFKGSLTGKATSAGTADSAVTATKVGHTLTFTGGASATFNGSADASVAIPTWATLSGKPTLAAVATSGKYSDLSGTPTIPTALKNPNALTVTLNGTSWGTYDGSAAKTLAITPAAIGALASGAKAASASTADTLSATLPVSKGGTGATTLAANSFLFGNGTSAITTNYFNHYRIELHLGSDLAAGWRRVCKISTPTTGYIQCLLFEGGGWDSGSPTGATVAINTVHTTPYLKLLNCYAGSLVPKIRLTYTGTSATAEYYLDAYVNAQADRVSHQVFVLVGNVGVSEINTANPAPVLTTSLTTARELTYENNTSQYNYASAVVDSQNGNKITMNYSASGLTTTSWLAAWNNYELRAISPTTVKSLMGLNNVSNTADADKNVKYATSAGSATSATTATTATTANKTQAALSWSGAASGSFNGSTAASFVIPTWSTLSGKPTLAAVATSGSYNDLTNKPSIPAAYSLPTASSTVLGGVQLGYSASGKYYALQVDSSGKAYVYVPWSDTNTTYSAFQAGTDGLVPAPKQYSTSDYYLSGDGTWEELPSSPSLRSLVGSSAIGTSSKPVYWNGSNFVATTNSIPSYSAAGSNSRPVYWTSSGPSTISYLHDIESICLEGSSLDSINNSCIVSGGENTVGGYRCGVFGLQNNIVARTASGPQLEPIDNVITGTKNNIWKTQNCVILGEANEINTDPGSTGNRTCNSVFGGTNNQTSDDCANNSIIFGYDNHTDSDFGNGAIFGNGNYYPNTTGGIVLGTFSKYNSTNSGIIVGNGTSSTKKNTFRVTMAGTVYGTGSYNTSGADYAEFVKEWADGNPDSEDRVGYFVTVKNQKLYIAKPGDYIMGIVSGNPSIVGNGDEDYMWKYKRDEFNRPILEEVPEEVPDIDEETGQIKKDENGNSIYKAGEKMEMREVVSEDYDPTRPYVERKDRPEWDYVGMKGVLPVRDDGTCIPDAFCKCGEGGIATFASERGFDTFYVIERINDHVVSVQI